MGGHIVPPKSLKRLQKTDTVEASTAELDRLVNRVFNIGKSTQIKYVRLTTYPEPIQEAVDAGLIGLNTAVRYWTLPETKLEQNVVTSEHSKELI